MKKGNKKAPCYNCGGSYHMEQGGYTNPPGMYWNGERYVKAKGSGTYNAGVYFQGGGPTSNPNYYPPKQQPGYWKFYGYPEDGGNITEIQYGGYIPASINAQPHILKQTDGTYHMQQGGRTPIKVPKGDPRATAYNDSLNLYNTGETHRQHYMNPAYKDVTVEPYTSSSPGLVGDPGRGYYRIPYSQIQPTEMLRVGENSGDRTGEILNYPLYKKPVQPYVETKKMGGYIPAPIGYQPQILKTTDGIHHMQYGGAISNQSYNGVYSAKPGAPIKQQGGPMPPKVKQEPGYWTFYPYSMDGGNITEIQYGGPVMDGGMDELKKGGWIQKATASIKKRGTEGVCTGSKFGSSSCPPGSKRYNLAKTFRKMAKNREYGGSTNPFHPLAQYVNGGFGPGNPDEELNDMNVPQATQSMQSSSMYNDPAAAGIVSQSPDPADTAVWRAGMTDEEAQANIAAGSQATAAQPKGPTGLQKAAFYGQGFNNLLGAGLMTAANFANRKSEKANAAYNRSLGMTSNMPLYQNPGGKGDYNQQGMFRTTQMVPTNPGMYMPGHAQYGGLMKYEHGGTYELDDMEIARLKKLGYKIQHL